MVWKNRYILFGLIAAMLACQASRGQSVVVQLLNGKTRKALKGYRVYVYLGGPRNQQEISLKTDREGKAQFDTSGAESFQLVTVGTKACIPPKSSVPNTDYKVAEVIEHGFVTRNECGNFNPEPLRGQLTILTGSASGLELFRN